MSTKVTLPDVMSLRQAAFYLDQGEQSLRKLAGAGTIKATKTEEGRWSFTKEDLDAYRAAKASGAISRTPNANGKAFVIRVKAESYEEVKQFLSERGIEMTPRYGKSKPVTETE